MHVLLEYEEPNASAASQIPPHDQLEPQMEQCPAYGKFN